MEDEIYDSNDQHLTGAPVFDEGCTLEQAGFRETMGKDWSISWGGGWMMSDEYHHLKPWQRVNHYPGSQEITRKDSFGTFYSLLLYLYHGLAVFNDDIQGTGCITAAVFLAALKSIGLGLTSETKKTLMAKDQRFVFLGAGAGGVGVADCLAELLVEEGLSWEEAREKFWLIDSRGLITQTRADFKAGKLAKHKVPYAKKVELTEGKEMNLLEAVKFVKPTALIGLSTIASAFNAEVLKALDEGCPHQKPVVF
ncbi:hypothetical protein ADUPG1_000733, partial [Aduncisulcus paluster]